MTAAVQPKQRAGEGMAEHRRRRPFIPVLILIVLALGAGGYYWWRSAHATESTALSASGAVEAQQYQVASVIVGRVNKIAVSEGDVVKQGQTLVVLDQSALKLQVDQAKQGVKAARAALRNAKEDGSDADVSAAKARLNQAEAAVDLAKVQLGYATVAAPHSGVVVTLAANAGENASPGRTLLTLTDPGDLFARVFVSETQIGNVKIGQQATVTTESLSEPSTGTVSFVASEAQFTPNNVETKDQRTKLVFEVRVRISDTSGALKAGMPVDVTFR
jgi:HlyD family secretion protein